ncbi:hypothetical protein LXD69_05435 [Flavobacterium sediminilitoris]|uniref:Outer membrane protein beta-barrel domain-containing protein n=1 Tax=Flavobacterium sediminilitoris TaxID=2024526 RepID=A0ABY4HT65_9FLAO|nr:MULTISPECIES: hypothetical protein [Flavobacterium]UOX34954.1 hypothetical protein LXD69_05435 [Flavobacterium sediminilitoris]
MKLIFLLLLISTYSFSQITFEKGYFVNSNNEIKECFIKNYDWVNSPSKILYKDNKESEIEEIGIEEIKEFGINDKSKFIKRSITIDPVKNKTNELYPSKEYTTRNEIVLLKVIVEGKANLYKYENDTQLKYYYSISTDSIKPLIFYKYLKDNTLKTNEPYKKELYDNLKCNKFKIKDFLILRYQNNDLKNIFVDYNLCNNSKYIEYNLYDSKGKLNFTPKIGYQQNSIKATFDEVQYKESTSSPIFGLEIEYLLPFNKNKFSLILDPTFTTIKYNKSINQYVGYNDMYKIDIKDTFTYSSISIPIGIRYNFFLLNPNNKIYVNGGYSFELPIKNNFTSHYKSEALSLDSTYSYDLSSHGSLMIGTGVRIKNINAELKIFPKRELFYSISKYQNLNLQSICIAIGYTI